jgi:hypothetical protein
LAKDRLYLFQCGAHASQDETRLTVRLELKFMVSAVEFDMKQEKMSELMRQHRNQRPVVAGPFSYLTHKRRIIKDVTLATLDKGLSVVGVIASPDQNAIIDRGKASRVEQLTEKIAGLIVRFHAAEDARAEPVEAAKADRIVFARALGERTRSWRYD